MVPRRRAPTAAALVLGAVTCICAACGGSSTVGDAPPQATFSPATVNSLSEEDRALYQAVLDDNEQWFRWKRGEGRYVAQDFVNCFEVNGLPPPLVPPEVQDDGIGHSRPRQYCDKAVEAIRAALPALKALADQAAAIQVPEKSAYKEQVLPVKQARQERLKWAEDVLRTWPTTDMGRLQTLVERDAEIYELELSALIVDFGVTRP